MSVHETVIAMRSRSCTKAVGSGAGTARATRLARQSASRDLPSGVISNHRVSLCQRTPEGGSGQPDEVAYLENLIDNCFHDMVV